MLAQRLPFAPGPVGTQRFLQPAQIEFRHGRRHGLGSVKIPGLVGIDHQRTAFDGLAQRTQITQIACGAKTHLELEGPVALGMALCCKRFGRRRVETTGVDRDDRADAAKQAPQRLRQTPGMQVPQRRVESGNALRDRAGLGGLYCQHLGLRRQCRESSLWRLQRPALEQGREHGIHKTCPVLGADHRKVAPDLAPAGNAVNVGHAHKNGRTVAHDAKRGLHRCLDRRPVDEGFNAGNLQAHVFRSISKWM